MSKGNSANAQIAQRLSQAQELIAEVLVLFANDGSGAAAAKTKKVRPKKFAGTPDFSMPIRPFVKGHAAGMNGAKKFVLLLAHLAQGDESKTVPLSDIQGQWNKMTDKSLLGMKFNRLYTNEAKNNDWVHTPAKAEYQLRPNWKEIFE
jgi:hypothetical protein